MNTEAPLGVFLTSNFANLQLIGEKVGGAVWSGYRGEQRYAIRCFPLWALEEPEKQELDRRFTALFELGLGSYPRPVEKLDLHEHTVVVEEWAEGVPWGEAVLSRDGALESSMELFDLLSDLHDQNVLHGRLTQDCILLGQGGRLKLLGLLNGSRGTDKEVEDELSNALTLLRGFLSEEDFAELRSLKSARAISRRLARLSSDAQPERAEPALVGRDRFLKMLNRALESGGLITVEAPGGGGKTRLIREWTQRCGAFILWGKATREVAPSPLQIFQEPLAQIEEYLGAKVNSPLRSLAAESGLQRSTLVWMAKLLTEFSSERSTVLVLEDVHWADDFTLDFIRFWNESPGNALLLVSFRPDEVGPRHPLSSLNCQRIRLPRLTDFQATRLLRSVHPSASKTLIESAIKRAEGNPFLLLQFVRSGTLRGDFLDVRLSDLDDASRRSLAVAAVLGDEFEEDLLAFCLGKPPSLRPCLDNGLLQKVEKRYRFTHDRFRDGCLTLLEGEEMTAIHLRIARFECGQEQPDPYRVAYHYQLGGRPDLGFSPALEAASGARSRHDLGTAAYYYQAALAGAPEDHPRTLLELHLGDCYRLLGRYSRSERCFRRALAGSTDPVEKVNILRALGDVYFKQAQLEKAQAALEEALAILGRERPRWLRCSLLKEAAVQTVRNLCRRSSLLRPLLERHLRGSERERDLLKASLYNRLAYVGWFLEGPVASIWAHLCELNLADPHGNTLQLARAEASHAIAMSALPWWSRALAYGKRSLDTARSINDRWCEGQGGHFYGAALLGSGRVKEARLVLLQARKTLEETGDRWEENGACYHLALAYYRLGALEKATELAMRTHKAGVEINDRLAAGDNLYTWARAQQGAIPRAVIEKEKSFPSPDLQRACELLAAEGMVDLYEQKYGDAEARFAEAWQRYREKGAQSLYSASIPCWLTTARRLSTQSSTGRERRLRLARTRRSLRLALRQAKLYPNNLPHALRELGLVRVLEGRHQAAREALEQSVRTAEKLSASHEAATSRAVMSHLGWLLGSDPTEQPPELLWVLGSPRPGRTSSAKLEALLKAATRLSQCLSTPTVLHHLCQGCKEVFGRSACAVVTLGEGNVWTQLSGDTGLSLPRSERPATERDQEWTAHPLPCLDPPAYLLLSKDGRKAEEEQLLDFLITVAAAALDRAGRTASSMSLSLDLKQSTALLDEEAGRLFQAREQLLLSERLALTGRLAAGLVHDLRNLVMAINGCAETLQLDSGADRSGEIGEILQAGRKSNQLLSQLSGLTRGDTFGPQRIDLNGRLADSRPLLRSLCGPLVELEFHLGDAEAVRIDPVGFDRIVLNLVMNARDAVPSGGLIEICTSTVEIRDERPTFPCSVPPGRYSLLTIRDDGCGIPEEVLPRIFELHFTTKGDAGSGIGLVTVLEIVETNRGRLVVNSSPDGTEFHLYLPPISSAT